MAWQVGLKPEIMVLWLVLAVFWPALLPGRSYYQGGLAPWGIKSFKFADIRVGCPIIAGFIRNYLSITGSSGLYFLYPPVLRRLQGFCKI